MGSPLHWTVEPGGLSDRHHDLIADLAGRGWGAWRIAHRLRKHPSTVQWFMYRSGLIVPQQRDEARVVERAGRTGRTARLFSRDEDQLITALRIEGFAPAAIAAEVARRLGFVRQAHSVRCRLTMLAALEES